MRHIRKNLFMIFIALLCSSCSQPAQETISLEVLWDKVRGGWAGQMIGVSYGAPTEFAYLNRIIPEDELPEWRPEMIRVL